ncbi:MAG: hypothetical protein LUD46_13905 [Parabacteroides sp.]|nr:hypothetical protein [Parabacteroides sp.]
MLKTEFRDSEIENDRGTVTFRNINQTGLMADITVKLLDASVAPDFSRLGGTGNGYDAPIDDTPGNIRMLLTGDNTFEISSLSLDGVSIGMDFNGGVKWLKADGAPATKAGSKPNTMTFSLDREQIAAGQAEKATITLTNLSGGKNYRFTVTPIFEKPVATFVSNSNNPVQNSFDGSTVKLYQVSGSKIRIKASGLGGSCIRNATGVTVTGGDSYATDNIYTVVIDNDQTTSGSFEIVNKSDADTKTGLTVEVPLFTAPTVTNANGSEPVQNSMSGSTIKLYRVSGSKINIDVSSVGGTCILSQSGVNVTGGNNLNTDNTYTVTWDRKTTGNGNLVIANKTDNRRQATITLNLASTEITADNISITAANSGSTNIQVTSPEGVTATVTGWGSGGQWFDITTNNVNGGNGNIVITQKNNVNTVMKPATIRLTNKIKNGTTRDITVTPTDFTAPVLSATESILDDISALNINSSVSTFTVTPSSGSYAYSIDNNSLVGFTHEGNNVMKLQSGKGKLGTATIRVWNKSDDSKVVTYKVTVQHCDYNGARVWRYNNFYIANIDAAEGGYGHVPDVRESMCTQQSGGNWYLPSRNDWNAIIKDLSYEEILEKGVFSIGTRYFSSTIYTYGLYYGLIVSSTQVRIGEAGNSNEVHIRCVAKVK